MDPEPKEPKQEEQDPEPTPNDGEEPKGKTVNAEKYNRLLERFNDLNDKYQDTSSKLNELSQSKSGDIDALQDQLGKLKAASEKALKEAKERFETSEKNHAIEAALLKAGCKDTVAARAHIKDADVTYADGKLDGVDIEGLKKDRGYLFGITAPAGEAGGANPDGGAGDGTADKLADVFGLNKKEV